MDNKKYLDFEGLEYYHEKVKKLISSDSPLFSIDLPLNTIVIWSGSEDDIPESWHICDGEEGTPDLRGKFVLSSSDDYPLYSEGGSETTSIMLESDEGGSLFNAGDEEVKSEISIMPPYYVLCYIMKIKDYSYTIGVSVNLDEAGSTIGGGRFNKDSVCMIEAIPSDEYTFEGWEENGEIISIDNPYIFIVNKNRSLTAKFLKASKVWVYGYDLQKSDKNPDTRISYPSDVDNYDFKSPARMNFSSNIFSYGDWDLAPGEDFMPKPCVLRFDSTVAYYLNPDDYLQTEDGAASNVNSFDCEGNAMLEWPKIYTKRWETDDGIYHFRCSNIKKDNDYECWSNYDKNNNEINHFYTPIYDGSKDNEGRLRSLSDQRIYVSDTLQNYINAATLNNYDDWYIEVVSDHFLIQDLLTMMFKTTDLQSALGEGCTTGNGSTLLIPGTMNTKGLFWGSKDKISGVKAFGREHAWGNSWNYIAGWIFDYGYQKFKLTRGTHDGTTVNDYNLDGVGYIKTDYSLPISSARYISDMGTEKYGRIPKALNGSNTTYETDIIWITGTNKIYYATVHGSRGMDTQLGPFAAHLGYQVDYIRDYLTVSLSCKPCVLK